MGTTYYGDITIDLTKMEWISASNFRTNVLFENTIPDLENIEDAETLSMWRQPMAHNGKSKFTEWRVLRNGQWVDSVYFNDSMDEDDVFQSLVEHDSYPADIIVLPVKKG